MNKSIDLNNIEQYMELYKASEKFKKQKSWIWIQDDDIFAIKDPKTNNIGYCCILGQMQDVFGMAVYIGSEGLSSYNRIMNEEYEEDMIFVQNCLIVTFEDREELSSRDIKMIKALNLKYRGRNEWPMFRVYEPGYMPTYIDKEQAEFLTVIINQACEVALKFKDKQILDAHKKNGEILLRSKANDNNLLWKDEFIKLEIKHQEIKIPKWNDEIKLQRIRKNMRKAASQWEIDYFYMPSPIQEGEKAYFPQVLLVVDNIEGVVVGFHLAESKSAFLEFQNALITIIEENKSIPRNIIITKPILKDLFGDMVKGIGSNIILAENFSLLEEAKENMLNYFDKGIF